MEVSDSDIRLAGLLQAARRAADAKESGKGIADAYDELVAAAAQITDIDRARSTGTHLDALEFGQEAATALRESERRVTEAITWSDMVITAAGSGQVATNIAQRLRAARAALTPFDVERLTDAQERKLVKACGVPIKTAPRTLAAIPGTGCIINAAPPRKPLLQPIIR